MWAVRTGYPLRVVSANDHIHAKNSLHYAGRAIDFQGSNLPGLAAWMQLMGFNVLWAVPGHYNHVHVESDR